MNRTIKAVMSAICVSAAFAAPALAQSNDVLKETHGDWEIRCIQGSNTCIMAQVGNTPDGKAALRVTVQRLKGASAENGTPVPAAMTVQAPLGILLPYGLRLKIDADKVVPLPVTRCLPAGCISQAPMLDEAVNKMKKGSKAVFGFFADKEVLVNVSLRGFTKAYGSLTPVSQ